MAHHLVLVYSQVLASAQKPHPLLHMRGQRGNGSPAATAASEVKPLKGAPPPWWYSLGKLEQHYGGDLESAGELEKAVKARSWKNELVLTCARLITIHQFDGCSDMGSSSRSIMDPHRDPCEGFASARSPPDGG